MTTGTPEVIPIKVVEGPGFDRDGHDWYKNSIGYNFDVFSEPKDGKYLLVNFPDKGIKIEHVRIIR